MQNIFTKQKGKNKNLFAKVKAKKICWLLFA
jgi:hypothetical protein